LQYTEDEVIPSAVYQFKLVAVNVIGDSEPTMAFAVAAANWPAKPAMPSLVSQSPSAITIQWTEPDDGGMPVTGYDVYWDGQAPGSETYTLTDSTIADVLEYTETSVVPGTVYKFKIVAKNIVGDS
jgi:hypothetical protein